MSPDFDLASGIEMAYWMVGLECGVAIVIGLAIYFAVRK